MLVFGALLLRVGTWMDRGDGPVIVDFLRQTSKSQTVNVPQPAVMLGR